MSMSTARPGVAAAGWEKVCRGPPHADRHYGDRGIRDCNISGISNPTAGLFRQKAGDLDNL